MCVFVGACAYMCLDNCMYGHERECMRVYVCRRRVYMCRCVCVCLCNACMCAYVCVNDYMHPCVGLYIYVYVVRVCVCRCVCACVCE